MKNSRHGRQILFYETIGCLSIIGMSWLDEVLSLASRLFGGPIESNWREALMETLIVLLVWVVLQQVTRRLLTRLHYLEGFLHVCAWCRKINDDEQWLAMEEYFARHLATQTSHSICPECTRKVTAEGRPVAS